MQQLRRDEVDERIQNFLAKKATRKNLSRTIVDWVIDARAITKPKRSVRYEVLPWSTK